jgi:hypothetical protein
MPVVDEMPDIVPDPLARVPVVTIVDGATTRLTDDPRPLEAAAVIVTCDELSTLAMKSLIGIYGVPELLLGLPIAYPTAMPAVEGEIDVTVAEPLVTVPVALVTVAGAAGPGLFSFRTSHFPGTHSDGQAFMAFVMAIVSSLTPSHFAPQIRISAGLGNWAIQHPPPLAVTCKPLSGVDIVHAPAV